MKCTVAGKIQNCHAISLIKSGENMKKTKHVYKKNMPGEDL